MSERIHIINDLIRDEIGKILHAEVEFNDVLVTVMRADASRTLEHATVYISVIPDNRASYVLKVIKKNIYQVQQILNKRLTMRRVPKIRFEIDKGGSHLEKIEKLLENDINIDKA